MKAQDLKNSILQLAIQGKLVSQDSNDEPADVLYEKIQSEKQRLIKEGKIKKDKPLPPIPDDEIPFPIPSTWKWIRLGDMCLNIFCGKSPKYSVVETPHKIIGQQANQDDGLDFKYIKYGTSAFVKDMPEMYYLKNYDVLLNTLGGGTIGRSGIYISNKDEKLLTDGHLFVFRLFDIPMAIYLLLYLKLKRSEIERNANGSTNQTFLNLGETKQWLIPLPPLAEQKRIVAKIEELEPLIRQYDKAETELSDLNEAFPEQLKKSILQYAIQGKLVAQDPNDEPADILYEKIQSEKQRLIKEGKIKKDKPLPPITDDEIPFPIPSTWKWVRLGDVSNYLSAKKKISPDQIKPEMWSLDLEDIEKGTGRILKKYFAKDKVIRGEKVCFTKGNILYSKLRPYLLKILIVDDDGITTPELIPFNFYGDSYQPFFLLYLKSPYVNSVVNSESYGVKMPRVGTNTMIQLLVPLPPLAEQKRIVAKIDELIRYCDKLKV